MAAFDPKKITRNRTIGWGVIKAGEKPGAITSGDCENDDGSVNVEFCKAHGIDPKNVVPITIADLPREFAEGVKPALTKLAAEWSENARDEQGKPVKWTADDVAYYLVLQSRMQDASNASIKAHRPVSDKAMDRATSTLVKTMKAGGKTFDEVMNVLRATGMQVTEAQARDAYGS